MKYWTEQLLTIAATLVIVGIFALLVHLPQHRRLDRTRAQFQTIQDNLTYAQAQYASLDGLRRRVEELRDLIGNLYKRMPAKDELGTSIEKIVGTLNAAKLVTEEINPQSPTATDRYIELPITIQCKGSFDKICTFMANLENMDRMIRITDLRLESTAGPAPTIKAKMVVSVFCSKGRS